MGHRSKTVNARTLIESSRRATKKAMVRAAQPKTAVLDPEPEVTAVIFKCKDKSFAIPVHQLQFVLSGGGDDLSGKWGSAEAIFSCPRCKKDHRVDLHTF